jgi:hypothetical protein
MREEFLDLMREARRARFLVPLRCGHCPRDLTQLGPARHLDHYPYVGFYVGSSKKRRRAGKNRVTFPCHPSRCGKRYTYRIPRLTEAYLRAFEEGRTEIVAGVDL